MIDLMFARIHAMPCVNHCWHCFCNGRPGGRLVDSATVHRVIDELTILKEKTGKTVLPIFYDEPTVHPDFVSILIHQIENGLVYDEWFFPTNGYGLSRLSSSDWASLAEAGLEGIRLAFHGTGEEHDALVGRIGAWEDLLATIRQAEEYDISWLAGMYLNRDNVGSYEKTRDLVEGLGSPCVPFGWMLPMTQGRASDHKRVRRDDVSHLIKKGTGWKVEGDFVAEILGNPDWSARKSRGIDCGTLHIDIDEELNFFYGGGCDGDPYSSVCKEEVLMGNLNQTDIVSLFNRCLDEPPEPVRILSETTWGELASEFGDPSSDLVYYYSDLTGMKWAEALLRKRLHR